MKLSMVALLLIIHTASWAAPAAWYQWRSKLNGELVCRQTSPGPGWEQAMGPYKGPHCEQLIRG